MSCFRAALHARGRLCATHGSRQSFEVRSLGVCYLLSTAPDHGGMQDGMYLEWQGMVRGWCGGAERRHRAKAGRRAAVR
jgi:hypothetical protein